MRGVPHAIMTKNQTGSLCFISGNITSHGPVVEVVDVDETTKSLKSSIDSARRYARSDPPPRRGVLDSHFFLLSPAQILLQILPFF